MRSERPPESGLTRAAILRRAGVIGLASVSVPTLLAACGDDDDGGDTSTPTASSAAPETTAAAPPSSSAAAATEADSAAATTAEAATSGAATTEAAATPVTGQISLMNWNVTTPDVGLGKGFTAAKAAFETANPGATVELEGVPFADFVASATTKARAKQLADVVTMLPGLNHAAIFPAVTAVKKADFPDLADVLTGWEGGIVDPADPETFAGLPIGGQGVVWYFNSQHFTDAGLDPAAPPTTWEELTAACEALKAKGHTPLGMSGADSFLPWWAWSSLSAQMYPDTAAVLKFRLGETPLNDPGMLTALDAVKETYDKGWWNENYADQKFSDTEAAFIAGEVSIVPGIVTDIMNWVVWDEKLGKDAYGVFAAPQLPGSAKRAQFYGTTLVYGTSKDTEELETARAFIEYLASAEGQTLLLQESGQFPNRGDVDVAATTGSAGAEAIQAIVAELGAVDVPQNQFNAAAYGAALQKLTQAITSGDTKGYLDDLQALQEQG